MRIAIIGGGISGLTCGWLLHGEHQVSVFEKCGQAGGHSNTVEFEIDGRTYAIDTGFIVFNDRTYPRFRWLLAQLGVSEVPTSMSFSVRCDQTGTEYCGSGLNGLFAQRRNLLRPEFHRMVRDILKFNRCGTQDAESVTDTETVGEYLQRRQLGRQFADMYLLPMGAAIWSCPTGRFLDFPIRFILQFYRNHGLLQIRKRPQWYTIPGGSRTYVDRLIAPFRDCIRLNEEVRSVTRFADRVRVRTDSVDEEFDEVILACHSDQARLMLTDASPAEIEMLEAFPYSSNDVLLHHDEGVLPRRRRAWAAWNYRVNESAADRPIVSYNMNILQHIKSARTFSVTLNSGGQIEPEKVISRHRYSHPVFTSRRQYFQSQHSAFIRANRTSYCGAWWGDGFHEAGVASAARVCEALQRNLFPAIDPYSQQVSGTRAVDRQM